MYSVNEILTSLEHTLGGPISEMPERIILVGELIISSLLVSSLTVSLIPSFIRILWGLIIVRWGLSSIKNSKLKKKNGGFLICHIILIICNS